MRRHVTTAMLASMVLAMSILSQAVGPPGPALAKDKGVIGWLLIESAGVPGAPDATGTVLLTLDQAPPVPLLPDLRVPAAGVISPAEQGCQPPPTGDHYHGTLYGLPDPNPTGCGWSRAVRIPFGSLAWDLGTAITLEEIARFALRTTPPDLHGARQDAQSARQALRRVVREVEFLTREGVLDQAEGEAAVEALEGAMAIDDLARDAIKDQDLDEAIGLLGDALAIKREVFRDLASAGVVY